MAEVRLINAIPLEKEMLEYARYIGLETTNECESTAECCADMVREAPTIDQESLRGHAKWVKDKELKFIIVDDKNDSHEESAICCTHCKAKISQSDFTRLRATKFGYEPVRIERPPQSWCYVMEE